MNFILVLYFLFFHFNTSVAQRMLYPWAVCRGTTIVNTAYIPPNASPPLSSMDYFAIFNDVNAGNFPPHLDLSTNVLYKYKANFIDVPPADFIGGKNWKLNLHHKTGKYTVANTTGGGGFTFTIPTNVPSGYEWKRDSDGKIMGEIEVSAMCSNTYLLEKAIDITLKYKPDIPMIEMYMNGATTTCANFSVDYFSRGATEYLVQYRPTLGFYSWINVLLNSTQTAYSIFGLDENLSYDFEVIASNPWGFTSKKVTRTRCLFPVIVSPIPSNTTLDVKTCYPGDLIKEYTITDVITGAIYDHETLEQPVSIMQIDVSGLLSGTYYISFKSSTNEVGGSKFIKSE